MILTESILGRVNQIPTMSTTVMRLSKLLLDESAGAPEFEEAVRYDPAVTANLLKLANSAFFGRSYHIDSVRQAIAVMGLNRVYEIAVTATLARVIPPRLPGYEIDAAAFWLHSSAVGILAERLASELELGRPDLIFTAGLLHDIGKLVIAAFVAHESPSILARVRHDTTAFVAAERDTLGTDHGEIGGQVARKWMLPKMLVCAAEWHHRPQEMPDREMRMIVELTHVADGLAHALGFGADAGELARRVDPAVFDALGLKPRRVERVAGSCLDEIREMGKFFRAGPGGAV